MISKSDIQKVEKTVQSQFGISELEYGYIVYDKGCLWLSVFFAGRLDKIAEWERSRIFWTWWKRQFVMESISVLKTWGFEPGELYPLDKHEKAKYKRVFPMAFGELYMSHPSFTVQSLIGKERKGKEFINS